MSDQVPDAPYKYFGLEFGRECHCGNTFNHPLEIENGECDVPCAGDNTQACGGRNRMNVFENEDYVEASRSIFL